MNKITFRLDDFLRAVGNVELSGGSPDEVRQFIEREFSFLGRALSVEVGGESVTVEFEEESSAVAEARRLADRAAKRAKEGNYEKAISIWRKALELQPSFAVARRDLAMVHFERGEMDAAKDLLIENLRLNPKDVWSWVVLGNIYAKAHHDLDAAEKHLGRALELAPDDPWALNSLGALTVERGDSDEAIRLFRRAIEANPQVANPYYGMALAQHRMGRDAEAAASLRSLFVDAERQDLRSDPVFENARALLEKTEITLAEKAHSEAFKAVENFRLHLEQVSGYPIKVSSIEMADKVGATIQIAWKHGRNYHLINCRAGYPEYLLDHLKAHELKHLEMECAARAVGKNRFYTTTAETRKQAILSLQSDIRRLERGGFEAADIEELVLKLVNGLNGFLFNCPLDMIIETNLRRDIPPLRDAQFVSVGLLAREAIQVNTDLQLRKLVPRKLLRASLALNGAYALFIDDLFERSTDFVSAYRREEAFQISQKLFQCWQRRAVNLAPGDEYELIDEFAEIVGLRNWYEWRADAGRHDATSEPHPEGTTNPELLRKKQPAAVWFFLDTLTRFDNMRPEEIRNLAFEVGLIGRDGLDYATPEKSYKLKAFPDEEFSGLQLMCFMYAGFKRVAPEYDVGMDLNDAFLSALQLHEQQSK